MTRNDFKNIKKKLALLKFLSKKEAANPGFLYETPSLRLFIAMQLMGLEPTPT